jgi:hypothetical protein
VTRAPAAVLAALATFVAFACTPRPKVAEEPMTSSERTPRVFPVELELARDEAVDGRVTLRVAYRGSDPLAIVVPDRPDQIEWFDPESKTLERPTPIVVWSAWRSSDGALALDSRLSSDRRASRTLELAPGFDGPTIPVDIGPAVDGLLGAGTFSRGWCVRAWLVGGAHPLPSNIICWRPSDR